MKKRIDISQMSAQHQFVWNTLTMLEDDQRILGVDLRQRAGGLTDRKLYYIIEDLRHNGYLVGGEKSGEKGYYEVRTAYDMARTLHNMRKPALASLNTANIMEHYYNKRFGIQGGNNHDNK